MTENEIRRLAHAVNDLRPDWPISSLTTFISNQLGKRAYRDAAVAMVWVAVDAKPDGQPASETPKRVLEAGPWWTAAVVDRADTRSIAPKRDEQCLDCGKPLTVCRTSVAACGQAVTRPTPAADPDRVATLAAAARAAITVDRDLFTDHPGDLEAQIQTQLGGTP